MFKALLLLGVAAVTAILLIACGGDDDDNGGSAPAGGGASGPLSVEMVDFGYEPDSVTARAGQELVVQLSNTGDQPHTFTIDGVVDSSNVAAGANGRVTFTPSSAGTLTFYCTVHGRAAMSGELRVN